MATPIKTVGISRPRKPSPSKVQANQAMKLPNYMNNDQMVDDILKTHTYEQIREKVNQIMRVKMIIDRTASQAKSMGKHNEGYSLESASKEQL